jgi:hypothetical protein
LSSQLSNSTRINPQSQTTPQDESEIARAVETLNTPNSVFIVAEESGRVDESDNELQEPSNKGPQPPPDSYKADPDITHVKNGGLKLSIILLTVVVLVSIGANIWLGV